MDIRSVLEKTASDSIQGILFYDTFHGIIVGVFSRKAVEMIKEPSLYSLLEDIKPLNILLIDDDMATQFVIAKSLNELGNRLDICDSACDAIKRIQRNTYDLIIVDLNLPLINGFELAKSLKIKGGYNGNIPKVFGLTTMDHPLLPALVNYSEIDDYVVKSVDYADLKSKIVNHCYLHLN